MGDYDRDETLSSLDFNSNSTHDLQSPPDFITRETYFLFLKATILFKFVLCLVGICTNGINIRAFARMGLKDSVTIVFFSLAISDFCNVLGGFLDGTFDVAFLIETDFMAMPLSPIILSYILSSFIRLFGEVTYLSTTFLAVQRCLCVVRPLHFKSIFTRGRTFLILGFIWLFSLAFATALTVYTRGFERIVDPTTNATYSIPVYIAGRDLVNLIYSLMFFIVFNTSNQMIVTGCVFVLAHALKKSVRFRKMTSTSAEKPAGLPLKSEQSPDDQRVTTSNAKERQVIVQVSLVLAIFLVCNLVRLCFALATVIDSRFTLHGFYSNAFLVFYIIVTMFEYANSSFNFFVYYKYNTKFRNVCLTRVQK